MAPARIGHEGDVSIVGDRVCTLRLLGAAERSAPARVGSGSAEVPRTEPSSIASRLVCEVSPRMLREARSMTQAPGGVMGAGLPAVVDLASNVVAAKGHGNAICFLSDETRELACSELVGDSKPHRKIGMLSAGRVFGDVVDFAIGDYGVFAVGKNEAFRCNVQTGQCAVSPQLRGATGVAVGRAHACGIVSGGRVRCVGNNDFGQRGTDAAEGEPIADLTDVLQLTAGDEFTCARLADHTVSCWGANNVSQLGQAASPKIDHPVPVFGLHGAVDMASDGNATCVALGPEEGVRCFGGGPRRRLGLPEGVGPVVVPMPVRFPKK
jgi:Regulator of chromosome condensation (RCC1) repeat